MLGEMIHSRYIGIQQTELTLFERPSLGTLRALRPMSCWPLIDFAVSGME
jgi:hypothetical protein